MPNLTTLTLNQLRAATKAQIITAITNKLQSMTKRQLIIWLWDEIQQIHDDPITVTRKDGQAESQVTTIRDTETGAIVSTRSISWTYYENEPGRPVDTITLVEKDAAGKETAHKVIKHYPDGRQPEVVSK